MRLLFDNNLSPRLARDLEDLFPGSLHIQDVGLENADDLAVWEHAHAEEMMIVTKDTDFNDLVVMRGHPPKVIWLRMGNCTTAQVELLLRSSVEQIRALDADPGNGLLALL